MSRDEGARSFARMLEEISDGELHGDASSAVHRLLEQLHAQALTTGQTVGGRVTLNLDFAVDQKRNVEIGGAVKVTSPSAPKRKATLWLTPGCNVAFAPPERQRGPVREVRAPVESPREVAAKEGT